MTDHPVPELSAEQRGLVIDAALRLQREFAGTFNAETIERYIADTEDQLRNNARFPTWLPILIERTTRDRLRAIARMENLLMHQKPAVLFLCVHNAGRSQMAAGWLRHLAGDRVEVYSGGSNPGDHVNPAAVEAMAEVGIDIADQHPQPWTEDVVRAVDVIVSMGCGDACPILPGKRYEDWELTDPAGQSVDVVRKVRDDIRTRVEALLASLELTEAADS
jgi:protein-tyrosine-phosphatase